MGFLAFLDHWWNLPFLVALGLVAVFFVLQLVGLFGDHDADGDGEPDGDADDDVSASVLAFFGVGRVPFMIVWVTLFLFGGFSGIFLNRVVDVTTGGHYRGWHFVLVSL